MDGACAMNAGRDVGNGVELCIERMANSMAR